MRMVKGNKDLKKLWNEQRRKIVPKVGQLTNDAQSIFEIVRVLPCLDVLFMLTLRKVTTNRDFLTS